jgi:RNA polymerase sigma factor (sigma-70 family)
VINAAASDDAATRVRALDTLLEAYWLPVYKYLRVRWRLEREDAEDQTQEFFARALERAVFARYDPARARFRTFLRMCLDGFASNERKASKRLKRGGDRRFVSLDFASAEDELSMSGVPSVVSDPDQYFRHEWVRAVLAAAVGALRCQCGRSGKETHFALFSRYDLAPDESARPTYAELAAEYGLPVTQVTNFLAWARREFRGQVLARLRETAGSDDEYRADVRELLGLDVA